MSISRYFAPLALLQISMILPTTVLAQVETVVFDSSSLTCGIQEAMNKLPAEGGKLIIPPGKYILRCPVILRDNLLLCGSGPATILQADDEYKSPLVEDAPKGGDSVRVADPKLFRVNDSVVIYSNKNKAGYNTAFGIVKAIEGDKLLLELDKAKTFRRDYLVADKAQAVHALTLLRSPHVGFMGGKADSVKNVFIRDLTIEGSAVKVGYSNWFGNAGAYIGGTGITIENVIINNTSGDGMTLSFAGDGRFIVRGNRISNVGGMGVHFGDNAQEVIVTDNIIENADIYGVYFCFGGQRVVVANNVITGAKKAGIGGIGAGGNMDRYASIANNVIRGSGRYGIEFRLDNDKERPGRFMSVVGNVIQSSGDSGLRLEAAENINVSSNTITQCPTGIDILGSARCLITANLIQGSDCAVRLSDLNRSAQQNYKCEDNIIQHNALIENKADMDDKTSEGNQTSQTAK